MRKALQNSEFIMIAATLSMGSTARAINIAQNSVVKDRKAVAVFSLEISNELSRSASSDNDADRMHLLFAPTPTETRCLAKR